MTTLVIGGTGKTGRRVAQKLADRGAAVRIGSRAGSPPFDWEDLTTWEPAVRDVTAVYLTYQPDLAFPGAAEQIGAFAKLAVAAGTRRIVLLSGRGEEETWPSEESVRTSGADWTILRCNWFAQNFSESFLHPGVMEGVVALPSPDVPEPFIDVADIAEVAVAALTSDDHSGRLYELSGPRAITFAEATAEISAASGREVRYPRRRPRRSRPCSRRSSTGATRPSPRISNASWAAPAATSATSSAKRPRRVPGPKG
ncbi:hypothetical protein GCM10009557_84010 [Virgisporangium ochraceum]